jgi:hypothetical protein
VLEAVTQGVTCWIVIIIIIIIKLLSHSINAIGSAPPPGRQKEGAPLHCVRNYDLLPASGLKHSAALALPLAKQCCNLTLNHACAGQPWLEECNSRHPHVKDAS